MLILHQIHGHAEYQKRAKDLFSAFQRSNADGNDLIIIKVAMSLFLRVHGVVDMRMRLRYVA